MCNIIFFTQNCFDAVVHQLTLLLKNVVEIEIHHKDIPISELALHIEEMKKHEKFKNEFEVLRKMEFQKSLKSQPNLSNFECVTRYRLHVPAFRFKILPYVRCC